MKEGKILPARITCELQKKCMEKNDSEYKAILMWWIPERRRKCKIFLKLWEKMSKFYEIISDMSVGCMHRKNKK